MKLSRLAPTLALGLALLSAPAANATPQEDRAYLDALKGYGIRPDVGHSAQDLVDEAHNICTDITNGFTAQEIAETIYMVNPNLNRSGATDLVDIAMAAYCPPQVAW